MTFHKAPGHEDLGVSFVQFANAQPEAAAFIMLMALALACKTWAGW